MQLRFDSCVFIYYLHRKGIILFHNIHVYYQWLTIISHRRRKQKLIGTVFDIGTRGLTAKMWKLFVQSEQYQPYLLLRPRCIVWVYTSYCSIERIYNLHVQERTTRLIFNKPNSEYPSISMFKELNWMTVFTSIKYFQAFLMFEEMYELTGTRLSCKLI